MRVSRIIVGWLALSCATVPGWAQDSEGGSIGGSLDAPMAPRATQPRPPAALRPASPPRSAAVFDGAWSVSAGGPCASAGTSQVTISGGRVIGQGGVSGRVSPSGAVSTFGTYNGLTIVGRGQITGRAARGVYRQSDGCSGPWSAMRL